MYGIACTRADVFIPFANQFISFLKIYLEFIRFGFGFDLQYGIPQYSDKIRGGCGRQFLVDNHESQERIRQYRYKLDFALKKSDFTRIGLNLWESFSEH